MRLKLVMSLFFIALPVFGNLSSYHYSIENYQSYLYSRNIDMNDFLVDLGNKLDLSDEFVQVERVAQNAVSKPAQSSAFKAAATSFKTTNSMVGALKDTSEGSLLILEQLNSDVYQEYKQALSFLPENQRASASEMLDRLRAAEDKLKRAKVSAEEAKITGKKLFKLQRIEQNTMPLLHSWKSESLNVKNELTSAFEELKDIKKQHVQLQKSLSVAARGEKNTLRLKSLMKSMKMLKGITASLGALGDVMSTVTAIVDAVDPKESRVNISGSSDNDDLIQASNRAINLNTAMVEYYVETAKLRTEAIYRLNDRLSNPSIRWLNLVYLIEEAHALYGDGDWPIFGAGSSSQFTSVSINFADVNIGPLIGEINHLSVTTPILSESTFPALLAEPFVGTGGIVTNQLFLANLAGKQQAQLSKLSAKIEGNSAATSDVINHSVYNFINTEKSLSFELEKYREAVNLLSHSILNVFEELMKESNVERGLPFFLLHEDDKWSVLQRLIQYANAQSNTYNRHGAFSLFSPIGYDIFLNEERILEQTTAAFFFLIQKVGAEGSDFEREAYRRTESIKESIFEHWALSESVRVGTSYIHPHLVFSFLNFSIATTPGPFYEDAVKMTERLFSPENPFLDIVEYYERYREERRLNIPPINIAGPILTGDSSFSSTTEFGVKNIPSHNLRSYFNSEWEPLRTPENNFLSQFRHQFSRHFYESWSGAGFDEVQDPISKEWAYVYGATSTSYYSPFYIFRSSYYRDWENHITTK